MSDDKKGSPLADAALGAVKLDWIRPLIFKVGGRKMAMGGVALLIIKNIVDAGQIDWPRAFVCLSVALVSIGAGFAVGWEDARQGRPTK